MRRFDILRDLTLAAAATLVACGFTAACHSASHPDDKQAVYSALNSHDLASVIVDQDRGKGVIKLEGIVGSPDGRDRAQQLAQQAAPGYTIDNQIQVNNTGLMGMANPNARPPEVEQMAHPPVSDSGQPAKAKKQHDR